MVKLFQLVSIVLLMIGMISLEISCQPDYEPAPAAKILSGEKSE